MKVSIVKQNGEHLIEIGGRLYPPLSFKSFRPNPRNISEFYEAGVRLYSVLSSGIISGLGVPYSRFGESWVGDGEYDFTPVDRQLDMFVENAPEAYFAPMFQLDTRGWYIKEHGVPNSFTHLSQIAGDEDYRRAAADYLRAVVKHCEEKYGDRIYGYFLLGGTTTEWFSDFDYEEPNLIKEAAYRRYTGDADARLPTRDRLERRGSNFLEPSERDVYDARRFHAELISDLILYFARELKTTVNYQKLVGLYFGYLFELGSPRLHNAGHLDYERVFLSPDINMISSPSSYAYRSVTDPSGFMVTQKTLWAHDKLYFLEFDHRTHTTPDRLDEPILNEFGNQIYDSRHFPGSESKCKNDDESINLMYRDFLYCQSQGAALWWFDMFDGWFRSERMMAAVKHMLSLEERLRGCDKSSVAEVAVFAEGESMYHVRKSSRLASTVLCGLRRQLASTGVPYDIYSISDAALPAVREYKLYIFVNQYDLSDDVKRYIDENCRVAGKEILWLYAPDYMKRGGCSVERICDITKMRAVESECTHGDIIYNGRSFALPTGGPYLSIDDSAARPLAYWQDGKVAAAEKQCGGVKNIYFCGMLPPCELLRRIFDESGITSYSDRPDVYVYVNRAFIGVYNATESDAESESNVIIKVGRDGVYHDLIGGGEFVSVDGHLSLPRRKLRAYMLVTDD